MRTRTKTILAASTLGATLLAVPALHAHDLEGAKGPMMGRGMMVQDGMMA